MPTLHWLTRDEDLRAASRVPYRLLEEAPALSAGEMDAGNMLIQSDKRPHGGNVLTRATLATIREEIERKHARFSGPLTVYGEQSRLASATLERTGITFKQMPYEVKART